MAARHLHRTFPIFEPRIHPALRIERDGCNLKPTGWNRQLPGSRHVAAGNAGDSARRHGDGVRRQRFRTPIAADPVVVSGLQFQGTADKVRSFELGAADYVTKPFSPRELAARVKAILRRGRNTAQIEPQILMFKHLKIDLQRHEIQRDGEPIELTALEFKLLSILATYSQMVLSREQLLERVWGYDFYGEERVVDVHIGHVRQKLEVDPSDPQFIVTVRGVGYKFTDEPL